MGDKIKYPISGITKEQTREFGMVAVLVITFIIWHWNKTILIPLDFFLILITIILPVIFYPFAWSWFGLARIFGIFSSAVMLTIVFMILVIPMGIIRKIAGYDGMKLKQFKKSRDSVLIERNHIYTDKDLEQTF